MEPSIVERRLVVPWIVLGIGLLVTGIGVGWQIVTISHHGTITVDSTRGTGTTFTITLPIHAHENKEGAEKREPAGAAA